MAQTLYKCINHNNFIDKTGTFWDPLWVQRHPYCWYTNSPNTFNINRPIYTPYPRMADNDSITLTEGSPPPLHPWYIDNGLHGTLPSNKLTQVLQAWEEALQQSPASWSPPSTDSIPINPNNTSATSGPHIIDNCSPFKPTTNTNNSLYTSTAEDDIAQYEILTTTTSDNSQDIIIHQEDTQGNMVTGILHAQANAGIVAQVLDFFHTNTCADPPDYSPPLSTNSTHSSIYVPPISSA